MHGSIWSLSGRLQLIWDSPILAGTAFAMLIPWLHWFVDWADGKGKKFLAIGSVMMECVFLGGLVLTQSRGPILAWMLATAGGMVFASTRILSRRRVTNIRSAGALAVVVLGSLATTTRGRMAEGISLQDHSVTNRLQVWSASSDLLWLKPWTGLGAGEAGWTYSQWFQPNTSQYLYTGVLNGFLEIGIERGVIVLWLVLAGIAVIALCPWFICGEKLGGRRLSLTMLGFCSWVSLLVYCLANLASSLHKSPTLVLFALLDVVAFVVFVLLVRDWRAIRRAVRWGTVSTAAIVLLLCSMPLLRRPEITVAWEQGAFVLSKTGAPANSCSATILVDRSVLGPLFGLELRKRLAETAEFGSWRIFDPRFPLRPGLLESSPNIIVTGRCIRFLPRLDPKHSYHLLLIHPAGAPIEFPASWVVQVWLPGSDELGWNAQWLAAARLPEVTIEIRGTGGQMLTGGHNE